MIYRGDTVDQGSFRRRKHNAEGNTIGTANINPIIDILIYEVGVDDGSMSTYSKNIIAEIIYAQFDE